VSGPCIDPLGGDPKAQEDSQAARERLMQILEELAIEHADNPELAVEALKLQRSMTEHLKREGEEN